MQWFTKCAVVLVCLPFLPAILSAIVHLTTLVRYARSLGLQAYLYVPMSVCHKVRIFLKFFLPAVIIWIILIQQLLRLRIYFDTSQRVHIHCRIQFWHICFTPPSLSLYLSLSLFQSPSFSHPPTPQSITLSLIPFS